MMRLREQYNCVSMWCLFDPIMWLLLLQIPMATEIFLMICRLYLQLQYFIALIRNIGHLDLILFLYTFGQYLEISSQNCSSQISLNLSQFVIYLTSHYFNKNQSFRVLMSNKNYCLLLKSCNTLKFCLFRCDRVLSISEINVHRCKFTIILELNLA